MAEGKGRPIFAQAHRLLDRRQIIVEAASLQELKGIVTRADGLELEHRITHGYRRTA